MCSWTLMQFGIVAFSLHLFPIVNILAPLGNTIAMALWAVEVERLLETPETHGATDDVVMRASDMSEHPPRQEPFLTEKVDDSASSSGSRSPPYSWPSRPSSQPSPYSNPPSPYMPPSFPRNDSGGSGFNYPSLGSDRRWPQSNYPSVGSDLSSQGQGFNYASEPDYSRSVPGSQGPSYGSPQSDHNWTP